MKKWSWKKISAIGVSMALALSLTFGLVFSDLSPDGGLGSADNQITDSVEGGVLTDLLPLMRAERSSRIPPPV